jgi:ribosomal protein L37AE/L43A
MHLVQYRHHGNVDLCDDCRRFPPTTTFGLGAVRCDACAKAFKDALYAKRLEAARLIREAIERHVNEGCPDDGIVCAECCEHEELDHGICCACEADLSDELCNRAHEISEGMER